jgi:hydroxyacylglutathione hydrolase
MFLRRFYDDGLAQASYLIGCAATGEAIVVDANRDLRPYLDVAAAEKLRITHVTETHIHADYVSGSRELARATGAQLLLSGEGGPDWQYRFAREDDAALLRDGDVIAVGNIRLAVMHTPGHTPEHLSFLVTDTAGADAPMGILSGDFVFVGDVGRPDLLERAANISGTMEAGARQLFKSLERFRALPDWVQVWPGHGAGSACGKALGAVPTSTVGYEKRFNWGVGTTDEATFVEMVLAGQPDPPRYFAEMKRINRDGPRVLGSFPRPPRVGRSALQRALEGRVTVIDTRSADAYAAGHVPGTLNIPLNKSFSTWAGWLVRYDVDLHLIADGEEVLGRAIRELAMIGLDRVTGWEDATVIAEWSAAGLPVGTVQQGNVATTAPRILGGHVTVVDVRNESEWAAGHLPGALHIPLGHLEERRGEIPRDRPIVVQCQSGGRSAIAASLLQRAGIEAPMNLLGGFSAWEREGHEVVRDPEPAGV